MIITMASMSTGVPSHSSRDPTRAQHFKHCALTSNSPFKTWVTHHHLPAAASVLITAPFLSVCHLATPLRLRQLARPRPSPSDVCNPVRVLQLRVVVAADAGLHRQVRVLHSCDLLSFYVCLESQNFCFLVLCGLLPDLPVTSGFSIEASINYLLLSAFSSGVLLFWTSQIYLQTGMTSLTFLLPACLLLILLAFMFKLGAAPMHMWVADIYQSISKPLLMYLATAPKLSLFGFWVRRSSMCGTAAWRSSPR